MLSNVSGVLLTAVHVSLCMHMEVNFGCDVCQLADLNATSVLRPWAAVAEQTGRTLLR